MVTNHQIEGNCHVASQLLIMPEYPPLILDLKRVAGHSQRKRKENFEFRRWVKSDLALSDTDLDQQVQQVAAKISAKIDCTTCGNCCKSLQISVDNDDIEMLAASQRIAFRSFERRAVQKMPDGEKCLIRTPCDFLDGEKCTVYSSRPKACRDFPYLHNSQFRQRMLTAIDNTEICPIAYNTLEALKVELGFRSKTK